MIYLDYAATTPVAREVADIMYQVLTEQFGNPSSQYRIGLEMKKQMELWRKTVADALDCDPGRLFFTSCGTEGDNWAITAALWHNRPPGAAHRHHRRGAQCRAGTLPLAGAPGI